MEFIIKTYPIPQNILQDLVEVEKELGAVTASVEGVLGEASGAILRAGGKRLRPALILMSGMLGDYNLRSLMPTAVASELIHLASLIHDDVLDNAETRRGVSTVNSLWGDDIAIAAGDYLFATAFEILSKHDMRAVDIMIEAALNLSLGELDQIETAHVVDQTMDDYLRKARRKTAALFAACCRAGSALAGATKDEVEALTRYGDYLGIAFQVYDDVLDVAGGVSTGKAVGVDVRDGTVTVPILNALDFYGRDGEFASMIGKQDLSDDEVSTAIDLIRESGAVDKTKDTAKSYVDLAFEALSILPDSNICAMFRGIGEFVIARYH